VAERTGHEPCREPDAHARDGIVMAPMAAPTVSTSVTELPESRVRVQAEVPPEEIEKSIAQAARSLGRTLRVPGFRAGKAPAPVVIKRVGREAVLDEAVRDSIGAWYSAAIDAADIVPVGEPELDMGELPGQGQPLTFSIEIGVRPTAQLGEYKGLEVGRREPVSSDEAVEAEVEQVRERAGRLETVSRPAATGDFVVMDYVGTLDGEPFAGGEGRDQMIELGSGRLVPGFEEQLSGASAGEERTVKLTFPEDYNAEELAGREAEFAVTVKEVKAKDLPPVDDELAAEAGFDTLDELRADIRERLAEVEERRIEAEFRETVLDAVVAGATIDVPDALVEARSRELWEQMLHSLSHQGISKEIYLQISGRSEEEIIAEGRDDARRQLKREAVLAAVVAAESIEPSEEELLEALAQAAPSESTSAKKLLERMRSAGRLDTFKADLAQRKALELLAGSAKPISVEQAQARDKLWTPGTDPEQPASELWTPGS
jgi:trigger factor